MSVVEFSVGVFLVLLLLGLAGYFAYRQKTALNRLRAFPDITDEDRRYVHKQTRRRLLCSFLMVVLAAMLVGWYFLRDELRPVPSQANKQNADAEVKMTEAQKQQLRWATFYWFIALMVVLAIAWLALRDFLATARFAHRQFRKLDSQRQRALEDELANWRSNRNGFQ